MSYNESLSANSNYPPMTQSQWDNAPFNEPAPNKEVDVSCGVSISLYHSDVMLSTDEYQVIEEEEGTYFDFEGCDLIKEYNNSPLSIINLLKEYGECIRETIDIMTQKIKSKEHELKHYTLSDMYVKRLEKDIIHLKKRINTLTQKLAMCENWEVSDIYVEEE